MNITVRLAWHNDGWNGHICSEPEKNTYCVGRHSYPGDYIKGVRDLEWEKSPEVKGKPCGELGSKIPACGFSINAFGSEKTKAMINPPAWFNKEAKPAIIDIPESTVCIWNYEGMYSDDVHRKAGEGQKYDYNTRLQNAKDYFGSLVEGESLIFYYANYSNPFSEDEDNKYVIVGLSRLKQVGKIHYYEGVSEEMKAKYAGGFVWQMPISSNYPEEGFSIPYHKYMDRPEVLKRILFVPDYQKNYKYATREVSNDDSLALVERFIEIVGYLIEIGDDTQNWNERKKWLLGLFTELWKKRGAYPGLPEVLASIDFYEGIDFYKEQVSLGKDKNAYESLRNFLGGSSELASEIGLDAKRLKEIQRNWKLLDKNLRDLLINVVPRFALSYSQVNNIISTTRVNNNIQSSIDEIIENPYILTEQYVGEDSDDSITFHTIDHGILPNPGIGLTELYSKNSPERFRALCVDTLKRETVHSFVSQTKVLNSINHRLSHLPEWKNHQFTSNYFEADEGFIINAIKYIPHDGENYLYLNDVYNDEREIQAILTSLQQGGDIPLKVEINETVFYNLLKDPKSDLLIKAPSEYDEAIKGQSRVCEKVFTKPLCVISGAAGTGKTTIIKSIIKSIEKAHGVGTGIIMLAPTGKASERIKQKTGKTASTIHTFLMNRGWLNENFTFKRIGGKVDDTITTLIIDECSMIDLSLFAALFRSINWNSVQRLILVGDPNQLPPIGRGKVFSDIINWMKSDCPDNLGKLDINVRQLENRANAKGNGILDLADVFIQENQLNNFDKTRQEKIFKKVQQGGIIDNDLRVEYWNEMNDLELMLKSIIIKDLEEYTGDTVDPEKIYNLWTSAVTNDDKSKDPNLLQILSPYRGEFYGTEYLNETFQGIFNGYNASKLVLDGIALYDKVIQFRNRPKSNAISAYDFNAKNNVKAEVYNGEIGFVQKHPLGNNDWNSNFRLDRFGVKFEGKQSLLYNYGVCKNKYDAKKYLFIEPVEENLELAYAISVHKSQGSEFNRVYFILPQKSSTLLSTELLYTAITRAQTHLTIFAQKDVSTFIELSKVEKSSVRKINSSIFELKPLPDAIFEIGNKWYDDKKVVATLSQYFVRSKSEMNIANILSLKDVPFEYETPKFAPDGSMYLPDFTIRWKGVEYFWEHVGRLDIEDYAKHWETKQKWYDKHFPGQLIITYEGVDQTKQIKEILKEKFNIEIDI